MSDHRYASSRRERVRLEQTRQHAHRTEMALHPLTPDEVARWRLSLSGLNTAEGKAEQLRVCRDLIAHAPEDKMLDSDAKIILAAIKDLEEELSREPTARTVRLVSGDAITFGPDGPGDSEDADEFDVGYALGDVDPDPLD